MKLDKIEHLCKKNNITIGQLEKDCGFSNSAIQKWQEHDPSVIKVKKVADYFKVTVDYILRE